VVVLIARLPNSFTGPTFDEFRREQRQLRQAEERRREAELDQWRRILEDPDESQDMKRIAREALRQA